MQASRCDPSLVNTTNQTLATGETLKYLDCSILREGEYGFSYCVIDQNGNRVTCLPTLQRAKNAIKLITNQPA